MIDYHENGSCEYADRIMKANIDKIRYLIFPAGISLEIPTEQEIADEIAVKSDSPEWRSE